VRTGRARQAAQGRHPGQGTGVRGRRGSGDGRNRRAPATDERRRHQGRPEGSRAGARGPGRAPRAA
ncbi:MAG: hypothetical protein AVDCRST_MAG67-230, partial [uncultured Solirubrobacteraceae bacterium]